MASGTTRCSLDEVDNFISIKVLSAEIGLRVLVSNDTVTQRLLTPQDDLYWREAWMKRHRDNATSQESGNGAITSVGFDQHDATKGWFSKPNLQDIPIYTNKTLNTNSRGLRGRTDYSYGKPPNTTRILIFGDSFTFGSEVSDHETYASYLQQMFPGAEVMNFGIHGYGHDQMLILLKEEGVRYQPDIVILGFMYMDISRNNLSFRDYAKPKFAVADRGLELTHSPVPGPAGLARRNRFRSKLLDYGSVIVTRLRYRYSRSSWLDDATEITKAILQEMVTAVEAVDATPVIVFLPSGADLANIDSVGNYLEATFFRICPSAATVECVSLIPYFKTKLQQGVEFKEQGHWAPRGHLTVAEGIREFLIDGGHIGATAN